MSRHKVIIKCLPFEIQTLDGKRKLENGENGLIIKKNKTRGKKSVWLDWVKGSDSGLLSSWLDQFKSTIRVVPKNLLNPIQFI